MMRMVRSGDDNNEDGWEAADKADNDNEED